MHSDIRTELMARLSLAPHTSKSKRIFPYRLGPEAFGYTLVYPYLYCNTLVIL